MNFMYKPSPYRQIKSVFNEYPICRDDHLIDFGCEKGRVLIMASEYGCKNLYGIDISNYSFLLAIADKSKQIDLLKLCNALLYNDGIIVFDIFQTWIDIIEKKEKDQCTRFRLGNRELYIVYTKHLIDQNQQLHRFDFTHESVGKDKVNYMYW